MTRAPELCSHCSDVARVWHEMDMPASNIETGIARDLRRSSVEVSGLEPPTTTLRKKNQVTRCHLLPRSARSLPHAPPGATSCREGRAP
jgi:hypothetical protein